jgi:transcription antitermination factor NusG
MTQGMQDRWIVATTEARRERFAIANIERQGCHTYLPLYLDKREHARPLFPRYLFVCIEQRWKFLFGTYGVVSVLMSAEQPQVVPASVIDDLRSREREGFYVLLEKPRYQQGQKLRLTKGPFAGRFAVCLGMDERERVALLLDVFTRKVRMVLHASEVEAA